MKTLTAECQSYVSEIVEKQLVALGLHNISTREVLNSEFAGSTQHLPPSGKRLRDQREPQARGPALFGVLPNFGGGEGRGC